jgi:hypothetical protein
LILPHNIALDVPRSVNLDKPSMRPSRAQCICSTVGFENPIWNAQYFPEECPEDWRLAYFMNDFRAVYLPCSAWFEATGQLEAIIDEMDERFELIIEWPKPDSTGSIAAMLSRLVPLKPNISCVVVNVDDLPSHLLDNTCRAISEHHTISLNSKLLDATEQNALRKRYRAALVWHPGLSEAPTATGDYQVVTLPCQGLRDIRPVLEQIRPLLDRGVRVGLFIEPAGESAKRAMEVRTLIELMELA